MSSQTSPTIDLDHLNQLHLTAGELIKGLYKPEPAEGKNAFNEAVTSLDIITQKYLAKSIGNKYPTYLLVGEEDTPEFCDNKFRVPISDETILCTIDPVDGSKVLQKGSAKCATVIGFQQGRIPLLGSACMLSDLTYIVGGTNVPVTINRNPVPAPRAYNEKNIKIVYGLGKRKPEQVREEFEKIVKDMDPTAARPGYITGSLTLLLRNEVDAYVSLKEEWYKAGPWCAIMKAAGYVTNLDPNTLDINDAFCAWFATPEFAAKHLQPGSTLAEYMRN